MEPFKNFLSAALIEVIAGHVSRHLPGFDRASFVARAGGGLESRELKARAEQIAAALDATLPQDRAVRARVLEAVLHPDPLDHANRPADDDGLCGWAVWPLSLVVARRGLDDFDRSMALLRAMTMRFSSEFAIRPFLQADQPRALAIMAGWVDDPNRHVRRLVSEGARPRLPWAEQLPALIADPTPALPLLERLRDDPEDYVRRSVANHLNDIARDHPALVVDLAGRWMADAPAPRRALLRHALRGRVKAGDTGALAVLGRGAALIDRGAPVLDAPAVAMGEALGFRYVLRSRASVPQALSVDYVLYLRKSNGALNPRVFKGAELTLAPGETREFRRAHRFREVTTRRHYPGTHRLALRINGRDTEAVAFELLPAPSLEGGTGAG